MEKLRLPQYYYYIMYVHDLCGSNTWRGWLSNTDNFFIVLWDFFVPEF